MIPLQKVYKRYKISNHCNYFCVILSESEGSRDKRSFALAQDDNKGRPSIPVAKDGEKGPPSQSLSLVKFSLYLLIGNYDKIILNKERGRY